MARSIGHDEWEREVTQDLDERGRVRVVAAGIKVVFRRPPTPEQIAQILAAHAPTPLAEARERERQQALAARADDVEALVLARCPPGTHARIVERERERAWQQMAEAVEEDLRETRRAARAQREGRGEVRALKPVSREELLAERGGGRVR